MLSRVANSVYWMSRYIERAENVARFIDVNMNLMLDLPSEDASQWWPVVMTTGDEQAYHERFGEDRSAENVLQFLVFDTTNPNSILSCALAARENARSVRQSISSEMWEIVNRFYLMVRRAWSTSDLMDAPHEFLTDVRTASHLFVGLTENTLAQDEIWHWVRLGRLIERADKTSRIVDVKYYFILPQVDYVGMPYDNLHWAALLKSATAFEMYRRKYRRIAPGWVAEFLVLDREFPRSIRSCIIKAQESLHAISGSPIGTFSNPAEQRLGRLRSDIDFARIDEIISTGLHEFLDNFQTRLNTVGEAIYDTFVSVQTTSTNAAAQTGGGYDA